MKAGWRVVPLGEVASVGAGNPAPQDKADFEGGSLPFIRTSDVGQIRFGEITTSADMVNDRCARKLRLVPKGTVLFPKSGASTFLNHRVITTVDAYVSSHLATITAKPDQLDSRFLLYALSRVRAQDLLPENSYPSLNLSLLGTATIPLPPLDEQKRIVAVLDEAFEGLSRARANTQDNKDEMQGVFRQRLIDLSQSNDKRFNSWSRRPLGELLSTIKNGVNCDQKSGGPYPITRIETISSGVFDLRKTGRAELSERQRISAALRSGDILFSHINSVPHVGKTAIFEEDSDVFHGINLLLMRTVKDVLPNYMNWYLKSVHAAGYWKSVCKQSVNQASVNQKDISKVIVRFPELVEQERIVQDLDTLSTEIERIRDLSDATTSDLDSLRQSLLQKAFSGELT